MYNIVAGGDTTWQNVERSDEEISKALETGRKHKLLETLGLDWKDMAELYELLDRAKQKRERADAAEKSARADAAEEPEGRKKRRTQWTMGTGTVVLTPLQYIFDAIATLQLQ